MIFGKKILVSLLHIQNMQCISYRQLIRIEFCHDNKQNIVHYSKLNVADTGQGNKTITKVCKCSENKWMS